MLSFNSNTPILDSTDTKTKEQLNEKTLGDTKGPSKLKVKHIEKESEENRPSSLQDRKLFHFSHGATSVDASPPFEVESHQNVKQKAQPHGTEGNPQIPTRTGTTGNGHFRNIARDNQKSSFEFANSKVKLEKDNSKQSAKLIINTEHSEQPKTSKNGQTFTQEQRPKKSITDRFPEQQLKMRKAKTPSKEQNI